MTTELERRLIDAFHQGAQRARLVHPDAPLDDLEGRSLLHLDDTRLEPDEQLVPVKENYMSVDSPPTSETRNRRRLVMAAAAVVAVIGVAAIVINSMNSDDDVAPSPAVAPTTVAPTTVAPRTETGSFSGTDGVPVTFTVPDGWRVFQGMFVGNREDVCCPRHGPGPGVAFMEVTNIYPDGCLVGPPVGPTVDDLVSALANVPGLNATAPVDVTVDGYAGKQIDFTVLYYKKDECRVNPNPYDLWYGPGDAASGFEEALGFDANILNIHNKLWILDVVGTRVVIHAFSYGSQDQAALDEILASIQIG